MTSLYELLRRPRGAATTEKLVVMMLGFMIIIPAIVVFGPILVEKVSFINEMLGGTPSTDTLANRTPETPTSNALLYVLGFGAVTGVFFVTFVAPLLFPRARRTRQEMINALAEKFEFLEPLADRSLNREAELAELRHVADELRARDAHLEGALEVESLDYANMAAPDDQTVTRDMPDAPSPAWASAPQPPANNLGHSNSDDEITVDIDDRPPVHASPEDPTVVAQAPADASLVTSLPAEQFPGRRVGNPGGAGAINGPDSGQYALGGPRTNRHLAAPSTSQSGKLEAVGPRDNYEPDAETLARPALDRSLLQNRDEVEEENSLKATIPGKQRAPDDPDATTQTRAHFRGDD